MPHTALLTAFYAAYNAHDAKAAAALYAEDGTHEEIAMEKSRQGRAALAEGLAGLTRMLPDVAWAPAPTIRSGIWCAVPYRMTGTFTPRPGSADVTPRKVALDGLHLLQIRDGQIALSRDYWDKDAFLAQIR